MTRAHGTTARASLWPAPCGVVLYDHPNGWKLRRNPYCNRPHGHMGPHREYDRRTAAVLAEWYSRVPA